MPFYPHRPRISFSLAGILLLAIGCTQPNEYVPPPPPEVTVARPIQKAVVESLEFTGTTRAFESVEVRARVEGFLDSVEFNEGDEVEAGQLLFRIDPRPFQASLAQAVASRDLAQARQQSAAAELEGAKASQENATSQYQRLISLQQRSAGAVTVEEVQQRYTDKLRADAAVAAAQAAITSAQAEIAAGEAAIQQAQLDLNYTEVQSPITGRVGEKNFDVGSLVGSSQSSLLTTVVRYDPIHAYFAISELEYFRFRRERIARDEELRRQGIDPDANPLKRILFLALGDEQEFTHQGVVDYTDLAVDESTGTYQVRGTFPNPNRLIPPGAFVRIQSPLEELPALLVSQEAVGRDQIGAFVLVVDSENKVQTRRVELGGKQEGLQIISGGQLTPQDRVIVQGVQRARPGALVTPVEQAADDAASASAAGP